MDLGIPTCESGDGRSRDVVAPATDVCSFSRDPGFEKRMYSWGYLKIQVFEEAPNFCITAVKNEVFEYDSERGMLAGLQDCGVGSNRLLPPPLERIKWFQRSPLLVQN